MIRPIKLNKTVIQVQKIIVKFHVRFIDSENVYHNDTHFNDSDYAVTNYPSYVTLSFIQDKNTPYDASNSLVITARNMFAVVKAIDKMIRTIYEKDIFATSNGEIVTYADEVSKNTITASLPFSSNAFMMVPSVVYDENGTSYEGVNIFINNTTNGTGLTIEGLEALRDTLARIDFFLYSQSLVNYYIKYYKCSIDEPVSTKRVWNREHKVIDWSSGPKTTSTFVPDKTDEEFNDLFK